LDLRRATDQRVLERAIQQTSPAIVCLGPIYKTFAAGAGEREENAAREVALFFDRLRERYGIALWLEHHAPLEQNGQRAMRPIGTSLWQRWPEFGIGLRKIQMEDKKPSPGLLVDHWRGERARGREWPEQLWHSPSSGWAWIGHWKDREPAWMSRAKTQGNVGTDLRGAS
jgi:replicative DNA helicase